MLLISVQQNTHSTEFPRDSIPLFAGLDNFVILYQNSQKINILRKKKRSLNITMS